MILFGKRHCGVNFFDAQDIDWTLCSGNQATWTTFIKFPREFAVEPEVFLSMAAVSASGNTRISLWPTTITLKGFTLNIAVWGNTECSGISVNWMATDEWLGNLQALDGEIETDKTKQVRKLREELAELERQVEK